MAKDSDEIAAIRRTTDELNLEVEISDLDPAPAGKGGVRDKFLRRVMVPWRRAVTPRQKMARLVVILSLLVLVAQGILVATPSVRDLIGSELFHTAGSPGGAEPQNNVFYFDVAPSWGQLSIDGHRITHLPVTSQDQPLTLAPGRHTLRWNAEPFAPLVCVLTVPANSNTDTCTYSGIAPVGGHYALKVAFHESLKTLPPAQREQLIQSIQGLLDRSAEHEQVLPGEAYALWPEHASPSVKPCHQHTGITVCYEIARQTLQGTLHFGLNMGTTAKDPCQISQSCVFNGETCLPLCQGPIENLADTFGVLVTIRPLWDFRNEQGKILVRDQPNTAVYNTIVDQLVWLQLQWKDAHWLIIDARTGQSNIFEDPVCAAAQQDAGNLMNYVVIKHQVVVTQQSIYSGKNPAAGCVVITMQSAPPDVTPTPTQGLRLYATCLHRFGVLLATNDMAHRLWPDLMVADAHAQQLAEQLIKSVGQ